VTAEPRTPVERAFAAAGRRVGERELRRAVSDHGLEPRVTAGLTAARVISALVLVGVLALLLAGVAAIAVAPAEPVAWVIGAALIGLAFLLRPRAFQDDELKEATRLDRQTAPALHGLVERVAEAIGTPVPDEIRIDHRFNAAWSEPGLRRRRILVLGLPLWSILDRDAQVALLAHELAHARNGDVRRSWLVASATATLDRLCGLLEPGFNPRKGLYVARPDAEAAEVNLAELVAEGAMKVLSLPPRALTALLAHLLLAESRRAEFYADALAADVAGTAAEEASTESLLMIPALEFAVQRASYEPDPVPGLFPTLADEVVRARADRDALLARAGDEDFRLDVTHPPTAHRLEALAARPPVPARVTLEVGEAARIDAELEPLRREVARQMLDAHLGSRVYG
jgi:heat shock protein HtpX